MRLVDFFKGTRETITTYMQTRIDKLPIALIKDLSLNVVAWEANFGEWYFFEAARAYIGILKILEKNADRLLTFMIKGAASKDPDWEKLKEYVAKIDGARAVPLIFHPYLDTSGARPRYFLRAHDACHRLALLIQVAIKNFIGGDVNVPGLLGPLFNKYGGVLWKSHAALQSRLQRYEFNQGTDPVIAEAEQEKAAIVAHCNPCIQKLSDPETHGTATQAEVEAVLKYVKDKLTTLDMTRPAQCASYLRDQTATEFARLNQEKGAYRNYLESITAFFTAKYPTYKNDYYSPRHACELVLGECDARNALILKGIILELAHVVDALNRCSVRTLFPHVIVLLDEVGSLVASKVTQITTSECGSLDHVKDWISTFKAELSNLLTTLAKYKGFDSGGFHPFTSDKDRQCSALSKDAFFQLKAYQELEAGIDATVAFAQRDTQSWIAGLVQKCCDNLLQEFSKRQGSGFDSARAITAFLKKKHLFTLGDYHASLVTSNTADTEAAASAQFN